MIGLPSKLKAVLVSVCLSGLATADRGRTVCDGFLPANNMKIAVGGINALGIDEASFNAVLTRVETIYAPIFAAKGKKLRINRRWTDDTVNAGAMQFNDTWVVNMYGGLARHKAVTAEGFALVACHEVGHHIGGFPKTTALWPTNEGGSDYFATLKCLRRVFIGNEDTSKLDPVAVKACRAAFAVGAEQKLCEVEALAGMSIGALFQDLHSQPKPPSYSTPDTSAVAQTIESHPETQCRLDTYYQGALCAKPLKEEQVNDNPGPGACTAGQGFFLGLRPRCWYKPPVGQAGPGLRARPPNLPSTRDLENSLDAMRVALSGQGR